MGRRPLRTPLAVAPLLASLAVVAAVGMLGVAGSFVLGSPRSSLLAGGAAPTTATTAAANDPRRRRRAASSSRWITTPEGSALRSRSSSSSSSSTAAAAGVDDAAEADNGEGGADASSSSSSSEQSPPDVDLHPPTLRAIADALFVRAQNKPDMPLRYVDRNVEAYEVTVSAGRVAQRAAEGWAAERGINPADDEGVQVMAGRTVAVLTRLDDLEGELRDRCVRVLVEGRAVDGCVTLGVPEKELVAYHTAEDVVDDSKKRIGDADAAIDAACLFDEKLRYDRARSLLAMFLHDIEGPGLRRNGVEIPCMEVDFLSEEERGMLFQPKDEEEDEISSDNLPTGASAEEQTEEVGEAVADRPVRPSLHPITIDAIEEGLRLRAQNSTTSPLRIINDQMEWYDVQYSIMKFAERFLEKHSKSSSSGSGNSHDDDGHRLTEEELQAIGGRIVGVIMRLDDLEWEWHHRVTTSSSLSVPDKLWKTTLGLHPDGVEQRCFRTVDEALMEDAVFARARAERMLALFLLNLERPGMEASGNVAPGGSSPDFLKDEAQLELMMPRPKKQ